VLFHLIDQSVRGAYLAGVDGLCSERGLKIFMVFVQGERMEGVLVIETKVRIQKLVLVHFCFNAS
jgi:hypothetical protein